MKQPPRFRAHLHLVPGALALAVLGVAAATSLVPTKAEPRTAIQVECTTPAACALLEELTLDVWSEERAHGEPVDVVVAASSLDRLRAAGATFHVIDADIDATAAAEAERLRSPEAVSADADFFADYRDYQAIEKHLVKLAAKAPERISVHGIGNSVDGRTIRALHITPPNGVASRSANLKTMLINGGQHAREWIAVSSTTCIADRLVNDYETDPRIKQFVDSTDVWIVPVVNPDGYQHAWAESRYWRKNRRGGYGVDLNRNFSVAWGGSGSSGSKRSDTYRGEKPFSEPETEALRKLVKEKDVAVHVDVHAYGQLLLFPWNHGSKRTDDHARYAAIGDDVASAVFSEHKNKYKLMRGVELYPAAGTMTDWMYGEAKATSFTFELRPKTGQGAGGFVIPPSQIKPTCDEALAGVLALRGSRHLR